MKYNFPDNIFRWENHFKTMPYLVDSIRQVNELCLKDPQKHMAYIKDFYNQLLDAHDETCDLYNTFCKIYGITTEYIQSDNRRYLLIIQIISCEYRRMAQTESVAEVKNNITFDIPFDEIISGAN